MSPVAWFEDLLPTKWAVRLAVLTLAAAGVSYQFPSMLPPAYLPQAPEQVFLLRLVCSLVATLVGTLAVLVAVLYAYNVQRKRSLAEIESLNSKHNEHVELLSHPAKQKRSPRI